MMQLQRKLKVERYFGGVNRKEKQPDQEVDETSSEIKNKAAQ